MFGIPFALFGMLLGMRTGRSLRMMGIGPRDRSILKKSKVLAASLAGVILVSLIFPLKPFIPWREFFWRAPVWVAVYFDQIIYVLYGTALGIFVGAQVALADRKWKYKCAAFAVIAGGLVFVDLLTWRVIRVDPDKLDSDTRRAIVLQSTPYTCLPACCCNVLRCYGIKRSEKEVAVALRSTVLGTRIGDAIRYLEDMGFDCMREQLTCSELEKINGPSILVMFRERSKLDPHSIVCLEYNYGGFLIIDPWAGLKRMSREELERIWKGKAVLIKRVRK
jgi:predicted double-glycine peptidase